MNTFICDLCGARFQLKVEIIIHLKDHQSGSAENTIKKKSTAIKGKYRTVCLNNEGLYKELWCIELMSHL